MFRKIWQILGNIFDCFWRIISKPVYKDVTKFVQTNKTFILDIRTARDATIHLNKKYFRFIVKKVVNDVLSNYEEKYTVDKIKYRFRGMDIFVSRK